MLDLDEHSVTEAALAQMANTPDPRLKEIMDAAVRHLHAFARDVRLTPAEWLTGIQFLTAVCQACTPFRQEFILLADVLGVSALVNAMHDKQARELGTQSSLLGPFYREGAPEQDRVEHRLRPDPPHPLGVPRLLVGAPEPGPLPFALSGCQSSVVGK